MADSKTVVYAAMAGNIAIAVSKFVAAAFTGSSAMLAEALHSMVDSGDSGMLLLGLHQSKKKADETHPFGHGPELYFWAFVVAVSIFGAGGGASILEGVRHLISPPHLEDPLINYIVLGVAALFEGTTFTIAIRNFWPRIHRSGLFRAIREGKDPTVFSVIFEDGAALSGLLVAFLGVFLSHRLNNPYFDAGASVAIGVLLLIAASLLGREVKGLLVGESVDKEFIASARRAIERQHPVRKAGRILSMYLGPNDVLLIAEVDFEDTASTTMIEQGIAEMEKAIKAEHPEVTHLFVEAESLTKSGPG